METSDSSEAQGTEKSTSKVGYISKQMHVKQSSSQSHKKGCNDKIYTHSNAI